jgi:hypothetical protein
MMYNKFTDTILSGRKEYFSLLTNNFSKYGIIANHSKIFSKSLCLKGLIIMSEVKEQTKRKEYKKPCIVMETTLEIVAGSPLPRPAPGGVIDPNQTFFP